MLAVVGSPSTEALAAATVPAAIRFHGALDLPAAESEADLLAHLACLAGRNEIFRSYLGFGYNACFVPPVIQRQVLENPGWYTAYTPYQPEISQGRLEALLVFQTAVCELTGLPVANASLLDEATAAAEAMALAHRARPRGQGHLFLVAADCHPQTLAVMRTRALPAGIDLRVVPVEEMEVGEGVFGLLAQNPATDGRLRDLSPLMAEAREAGAVGVIAADPLSLALVRPPGEMGAAVAVGSMQRFGVPLGYGGPHAAYMATEERLTRKMPGRIVGVARDSAGRPALRLALQTREQHIRRDRATSNICTAQVLLAVMSGMYAVWHGPSGLVRIARRTKGFADALAGHLADLGFAVSGHPRFDTVRVAAGGKRDEIVTRALGFGINLRPWGEDDLVVALDETVGPADLVDLVAAFGGTGPAGGPAGPVPLPPALERTTPCLAHEVFSSVKSEHDMVRYLHRLESKDLCLTTS
ncbi:glycine dehydrogenase (aminomethyl-transferring), partial [bacterium]|nr:glycine dehydrogenase (aminomethyl-transferring) [bacterium]